MSSPRLSSQYRSTAATPKKGSRCAPPVSNVTGGRETAVAAADDNDDLFLTQHNIHTLPCLQELMRPTAARRIAAAARLVHMEAEAVTAATSGGRSASTLGVAGSGSASATSPPPPPPPPSYAAAATSTTTTTPTTTTTTTAGITPPTPSTVPSLALLLECTTQLSGLLAQWRACNTAGRRETWRRPPQAPPPLPPPPPSPSSATDRKNASPAGAPTPPQQQQQQQPARPSAERVLQLMDVILWYCLSTSDDARLAYCGRSRGTSGRATPALPGTAAAVAAGNRNQPTMMGGSSTPYGVRGGGRGRANSVGRSGSSSTNPMDAGDWLSSRMSSASSVVGVPAVTMPDEQLAEHLLRPAVDAVVLLQDRLPLSSSSSSAVPPAVPPNGTANNHSNTYEKGKGRKGSKPATTTEEAAATDEADMGKELQTVALWMLAAVLVRFADAPFNATVFLPVLFPLADVRGGSGGAARHPLLQPLLHGDKAQTPQRQLPATRQRGDHAGSSSNTSLRWGAAVALTALLQKLQPTLRYAEEPDPHRQAFVSLATQCGTMLLSLHESLCWGLEREGGHRTSTAGVCATVPLLTTYATVVSVTPYNRCPRSRAAVLQTLQLPVVRAYLIREACAEYVPMTALVTNVFKNESMRGAAAQLLPSSDDFSGSSTKHEGKVGGKETSAPAATTPTTSKEAVGDAAGDSRSFLSALLQHADTRVEVWRCMVPLSRLYPRMVHSEFDVLMAASISVVSTLARWEAAEEATEKIAMEERAGCEGVAAALNGSTTPWNQPEQHSTGPSATTSPARAAAGGGAAVVHHDPNNDADGDSSGTGSCGKGGDEAVSDTPAAPPDATPSSPSSGPSRLCLAPATSPEALAECLRTWLHFMGYVWKAFDDNACDPALSQEGQQDRATLAQRRRIHEELLRPAMQLRRCGEDVRTMTLRCIAHIGNDYLSTITDITLGEELVRYVQTCLADPQPRVRGEALTTLGVWLWQYPSMDAFACVAIDNAVHSLSVDPNALVRTKAAFALSNVTGRLPEGTCPTVRYSPDYIALLCATAMHAAVIDGEAGVQGHGIRMMNHLLQVLTFEELISEVTEFEEGVAEGFLRVLLECLRAATRGYGNNNSSNHHSRPDDGGGAGWYAAPHEAKHRWNAACALGMGLAREEVFEAEPKYAIEAVDALCTAVVRDHIFKVRTQAAGALGRIPGHCLCATYSAVDLTPKVVRSLCEALETASATENFRQYKEQGSLHDALHGALSVMITTAKPSIELDKVFSSYQKLLQKEQLL
jgi:hypothetical protein